MKRGGRSVGYGSKGLLLGCVTRCTVSTLLIETDGEEFNVTETLPDDC